jgi:hypothetical protein
LADRGIDLDHVAAVWVFHASVDAFVGETFLPALHNVTDGFTGPPEQRSAEFANLVAA